ncbi:hypothetical protein CR513_06310, partial [Mucuna pruriens]
MRSGAERCRESRGEKRESSSKELTVFTQMKAKLESLERRMEEMGHELIESFTQQVKTIMERSHRLRGENDRENKGSSQEKGNKEKFVKRREERMRRTNRITWLAFKRALLGRFQSTSLENPYEVFMGLRQTHYVEEYTEMFELISTPLRHVEEEMLKGAFMNGLKEEVRVEIRLHSTGDLGMMMKLA